MSNQELDKLFKNKLEAFEKTPQSDSWSKIQTGIKVPVANKGLWFYTRVAAAVLLLISLAGVLWFMNVDKINNDVVVQTQEDNNAKAGGSLNEEKILMEDPKTQPELNEISAGGDVKHKKSREESLPFTQNQKSIKTQKPLKKESLAINSERYIQEPYNQEDAIENDMAVESLEKNVMANATDKEVVASTKQEARVTEETGQTIILNIEDFEKRVVKADKPRAFEEEKENEENKGVMKVIQIIKEVKESEHGLGDIRRAKNELFALNFKKGKDELNK